MDNNFSNFIFDPLTWFTFNILGNIINFGCETLCKDLKTSTIPYCFQIKLKRLLEKRRHWDWMTNPKEGLPIEKLFSCFFWYAQQGIQNLNVGCTSRWVRC